MTEKEEQLSMSDVLFMALVRDFESMAMVGFGKLVDPVTQKAERNLDRAKVAIDMLGMLDEKTRGNLNQAQTAMMRQVLTNLRLNYVDEADKEKAEAEKKPEEKKPDEKDEAGGEPGVKAAPGAEEKDRAKERAEDNAAPGVGEKGGEKEPEEEQKAGDEPEAAAGERAEDKTEPAAGKKAEERAEDKTEPAAGKKAEAKPKEPKRKKKPGVGGKGRRT
jgi:hypothetical protein